MYTVYIRYFWLGNHHIYGVYIRVYTVLANPIHQGSMINCAGMVEGQRQSTLFFALVWDLHSIPFQSSNKTSASNPCCKLVLRVCVCVREFVHVCVCVCARVCCALENESTANFFPFTLWLRQSVTCTISWYLIPYFVLVREQDAAYTTHLTEQSSDPEMRVSPLMARLITSLLCP